MNPTEEATREMASAAGRPAATPVREVAAVTMAALAALPLLA